MTYSPSLTRFQTCTLPEQQQGPPVVSSVLGEQVAGGKRGGEQERQTTSEGRLVNSGNMESSESAVCAGHDLCQYRLMKAPCSATLHRGPSVSGERPRRLCGNRRECLCSHNTWKVLAEDNQSWKYIPGSLTTKASTIYDE